MECAQDRLSHVCRVAPSQLDNSLPAVQRLNEKDLGPLCVSILVRNDGSVRKRKESS
jgi:hypothetical protein